MNPNLLYLMQWELCLLTFKFRINNKNTFFKNEPHGFVLVLHMNIKFKFEVVAHRVMDLPAKKPYQWRNEYPTKKPRIRQELVGEIHPAILPPSLAGIVAPGAKPVVFTVKV